MGCATAHRMAIGRKADASLAPPIRACPPSEPRAEVSQVQQNITRQPVLSTADGSFAHLELRDPRKGQRRTTLRAPSERARAPTFISALKVFSHEALRKFCREKAAAPREPVQLSFKINAKTTRCEFDPARFLVASSKRPPRGPMKKCQDRRMAHTENQADRTISACGFLVRAALRQPSR